ncbi:MAG: methyltransferase domain-containing protein [Chloroflexi bacterium]|nr:methyltransferase domain-containing protein [Chloroflexota bacterium]
MHSHVYQPEPAPATHGRLIRWAWLYDRVVNWLMLGRARELRATTVDLARIQPGETILDVGCGTGDLTLAAKTRAGQAGKVSGIDAAPEMIAVARRKAAHAQSEVDFRVSAVEALPFPDATFDVVLSSLMMHHLPLAVKQQGLGEIHRVLKPGGRLVIIDMQRPTTLVGRAIIVLSGHAVLREGVQDLPPLMSEAGFARVQASDTAWRMLGLVVGWVDG